VNYELFPEPDDAVPAVAGDGPVFHPKRGPRTPCITCGHELRDHHSHPESHWENGSSHFFCITRHCTARVRTGQESAQCTCMHYLPSAKDKPKFTKPTVDAWTRCARPGCGHFRRVHCSRGVEALEIDYVPYICRHYRAWMQAHVYGDGLKPACTDTACGEASGLAGAEIFCDCDSFVSPFARSSTGKRKATAVSGDLFSPAELEEMEEIES
jgi:hypothetical protein